MSVGHIFIYNYIGSGPGEISVKNIQAQIDPKATEYNLHIVSGGGDVFEGFGIYNLLKNTGKKITTLIEGDCASIATLIAFAGEKIIMNTASRFMIHNPHISDLKGDARVLRNVANQLEKIKTVLLDVSQARSQRNGKDISREVLSDLYDKETYMSPVEAQRMGFVDEVQDAIKAVAKINVNMETNVITKFFSWFKKKEPKMINQMMETLEDGRAIMVMAEGDDWVGAQVVLETGEMLPAGDYVLGSGATITVDENSTITQKTMPEVTETPTDSPAEEPENQTPEDMKKIEELETKVAELTAKLEAETQAKTQAQNISAQFENRLTELSKTVEGLKTKTVGDTTPLPKGPAFKSSSQDKPVDMMGEFALNFYKNRHLIKDED